MGLRTKIQIQVFQATSEAQPLHNGTNLSNGVVERYPKGFIIQTFDQPVHIGDKTLLGEENGYTIGAGCTLPLEGFLSRGSFGGYDLTQMYYVGGPFKLILERSAKRETLHG